MIEGVDTAYPHASYPPWAKVVCGYAGGHTPHQWTPTEVAAVRDSGRHWWAIWTSLNSSGTLTAALGAADAKAMAARLPVYGYSKNDPVLYDVEPAIFDRDPAGARAAITAWKAGMHAAGYPKAYVYTVARQGGDWIANWTNVKPRSIPAGKIGVQYGGDQGGFDYNVFADSLISPIGDPPVTPAEITAIAAAVWNHQVDSQDGKQQHSAAYWLENPNEKLTAIAASINPAKLAAALAPLLAAAGPVTEAALEQALRTVLGSLDN